MSDSFVDLKIIIGQILLQYLAKIIFSQLSKRVWKMKLGQTDKKTVLKIMYTQHVRSYDLLTLHLVYTLFLLYNTLVLGEGSLSF